MFRFNGNSAHNWGDGYGNSANSLGSLGDPRGALPPGWWFCRVTVWRMRP